jgi:GcrA cell cycle regulator
MEWTDDTIAQLRALWAEGLSTAEIGRRMLISKNAVVGKAHRLSLAARPSPIRRAAAAAVMAPMPPRRLSGPTLPPLSAPPSLAPSLAPALAPAPPPTPVAAPAAARVRPPVPPAVLAPVRAPARPVRAAACCWPIGEPGTPSFHFCGGDAAPGKPYCAEHAQIAYVKVRDRREEAA